MAADMMRAASRPETAWFLIGWSRPLLRRSRPVADPLDRATTLPPCWDFRLSEYAQNSAATLRRGLHLSSSPGANQRVHGTICRPVASVRFDLFPKVRQSLRKFLRCLYAFPEGVGAIVEQLMKTRIC